MSCPPQPSSQEIVHKFNSHPAPLIYNNSSNYSSFKSDTIGNKKQSLAEILSKLPPRSNKSPATDPISQCSRSQCKCHVGQETRKLGMHTSFGSILFNIKTISRILNFTCSVLDFIGREVNVSPYISTSHCSPCGNSERSGATSISAVSSHPANDEYQESYSLEKAINFDGKSVPFGIEEEAKNNSNKGIHDRVFNDRLMDMDTKNICGNCCINGKKCLTNITLQSIIDARIDFWGTEAKPMNRETKYTKLLDLVSKKGNMPLGGNEIQYLVSKQNSIHGYIFSNQKYLSRKHCITFIILLQLF